MQNMSKDKSVRSRGFRRMAWAFLAGAVFLAGCAAQPKSNAPAPEQADQPTQAQPAETVQSTTPLAAKAETAPPRAADQPAARTESQAEPVEVKKAPPAKAVATPPPAAPEPEPVERVATQKDEPKTAKPTIGAQAPRSQEKPTIKVEPARDRAAQDSPAAKPVKAPPAGESPKAQADVKSQQAPQRTKPPTPEPESKKKEGCGDKSNKPAPKPTSTGPQPLWVCKEPKVVAESVWRGQMAEFVFAISNEGEGDLNIKLKGG